MMTLFSKHSMHILLAYVTHSILMDVQIAFFNGAYSVVHIWKLFYFPIYFRSQLVVKH
jgi:hypothetical protein